MRIKNGKGTRSYRSCINPECEELPIGVLKGLLMGEYFETQVPYCKKDEAYANQFVRERFRGIPFVSDTRGWFRQKQEKESTRAIQDETQPKTRKRTEG